MKELSAKEKYRLFILDTVGLLYLSLDLENTVYSVEELSSEIKRIKNRKYNDSILIDIKQQIEIDFKLL